VLAQILSTRHYRLLLCTTILRALIPIWRQKSAQKNHDANDGHIYCSSFSDDSFSNDNEMEGGGEGGEGRQLNACVATFQVKIRRVKARERETKSTRESERAKKRVRERDREKDRKTESVCWGVCVCKREKVRERQRARTRVRVREKENRRSSEQASESERGGERGREREKERAHERASE